MIKKIFRLKTVMVAFLMLLVSNGVSALTCNDLNGAYLFSQESERQYLGFFGSEYASESINNEYGTYGSPYRSLSVRNEYGTYGSPYNSLSATNDYSSTPPAIYKNGNLIGFLTTNTFITGHISLSQIDEACTLPYGNTSFSATTASFSAQYSIGNLSGLQANTYYTSTQLTWNSVAYASSYHVYKCSDASCTSSVFLGDVTTPYVTITSLEPSQTYHYAILPVNSDDSGDAGYISVTTLTDSVGPIITLLGASTITHQLGDTYTDAGATATDAVDGTITVTTSGSVDVNTAGTYTLTYSALDAAGNTAVEVTRIVTVADSGFPDTTPPQLESWEITSSRTINVDNGAAIVSVQFRITDPSGFDEPRVTASHDSGQTADSFDFGSSNLFRVSGDNTDGTWQADISISQGSASGVWSISLFPLQDSYGNSSSFGPSSAYDDTFTVITEIVPDTTPPQLESWEITSSRTINVDNGAAIVSVQFRITDPSGFDEPRVTASHDSGQTADSFDFGSSNLFRVSGDNTDGTWQADISISQGSASGVWSISLFPLQDSYGNLGSFGPPSGYKNTFFVGPSYPSIDIDGNGQYDALTDGLLLLRGMFGLTGSALVDGAVASDALYTSEEEIKGRIDMLGDFIDIDDNGTNDALTDGLVILRYLFGLRGAVLVDGVIASDALVQSAEGVGEKIDSLMPPPI